MIPVSFVSLPSDVSLPSAFFTAVGIMIVVLIFVLAICIIAASFVTIITYIICECICSPIFERYEVRDIEIGRPVRHRTRIIAYQSMDDDPSNYSSIDVLDELPRTIRERQMLRKQALEKLLPPVIYESKETLAISFAASECSICLDDYMDGESCRVFPACKHVFHLKCIDGWLKNHLTCPVCRKCLLDC